MTVIAYRAGVLAADSRATYDDTGITRCTKIFRKAGDIIGVSGEDDGAMMLFVDWYGTGRAKPDILVMGEADIGILVLTSKGLLRFDKWCRGERVAGRYYAIGSGAYAAMGAMHAGASARRAVEIACRVDPQCGLPVASMRLK